MSVVAREQCPTCLDSGQDNLITFDDGGKKCFACGYKEREKPQVVMEQFVDGHYGDLKGRGISKRTCEKFHYQVGSYSGMLNGEYVAGIPCHVTNYLNDFGQTVAQKIRASQKRMKIVGGSLDLYGKWLWEPSEKISLVITEGEIDALSVAEAGNCKYPVVSIPNGAQSAVKFIKKNLEWCSKFKHVVLCFDQDDAGQNAVKEVAELFPPNYVKICLLTKKDANEELLKLGKDSLNKAILNAKTFVCDSIVTVDDLVDKLKPPQFGLTWPWQQLTKITYGIQMNSIYTIGAGSGIGKTTVLGQIVLHLITQHDAKVGAIFLEQKPELTLTRIIGEMLGKRLHVPGEDWDEEEVAAGAAKLKENLFFYDHYGAQDLDSVINKIRYLVKGLDCKYIFLDHLTALAAEMDDERKGIDKAMAKLGALVHELDFTLFLVSHLAKPQMGASYEEGRVVTASAFRGSQSIQYWSTFMLGLERNKLAKDAAERNITTVRVLKDRFTGEADGVNFHIQYNKNTGKLDEIVF